MVAYTKGGYWVPTIPGQICEGCGGEYTAHRHGSRFCGRSCAGKARMAAISAAKAITRTCVGCAADYQCVPSTKGHYCSTACRVETQRKKRERTCQICGTVFYVRSAERVGASCSRACELEVKRRAQIGRVHSEETKEKHRAAMRRSWADPVQGAARRNASSQAMKRLHADPTMASEMARQASERMKRRHADPEWQKIRDARSSRTMQANWEKHRDKFIREATERFYRREAEGVGLNSGETDRRKREAAKWIMKRAQEALHTETDFDEVWARVMDRLRAEMPYEGDADSSDYYEYLGKLGRAVARDPEVRAMQDGFMSVAISRFAVEWQAMKNKRQS